MTTTREIWHSGVHKGIRDGWRATSTTKLSGPYTLKFATFKGNGGKLITSVSVCKLSQRGGFAMETFRMFTDYMVRDAVTSNRCTAKTVAAQHDAALAKVEHYVSAAEAHNATVPLEND